MASVVHWAETYRNRYDSKNREYVNEPRAACDVAVASVITDDPTKVTCKRKACKYRARHRREVTLRRNAHRHIAGRFEVRTPQRPDDESAADLLIDGEFEAALDADDVVHLMRVLASARATLTARGDLTRSDSYAAENEELVEGSVGWGLI